MIELLIYLPFLLSNLLIMCWIIRKRGFFSFEGYGTALLIVVVVSDFIGLVTNYLFRNAEVGNLIQLRIYPTAVHIIGLVALAAGLFMADPRPIKVTGEFSIDDRKFLIGIARFFVVLGLGMKLLSLYGEGITSVQSYFLKMPEYVIAQRRFGGFWDEGLSVMLLGLTLIAANQMTYKRQGLLLIIAMMLNFFLSPSRAGIAGTVSGFFVILWAINRKMLRFWLKPVFISSLALLVILSAGIKSQVRFRPTQVDTSFSGMFYWGVDRFLDRFSSEGLYDGYANFVSRVSKDKSRFYKGDVIKYAVTAWVPYVVYKNKPQHPFRAIGDLVYKDFRVSAEDVSAVMLVGTAFADYGILSVICYLFLYGVVIGSLRRLTMGHKSNMLLFAWYIHFMVVDGASNFVHGGIVNLINTIALATGVITLTFIYLLTLHIMRAAAGGPEAIHYRIPTFRGCFVNS
jgi:hypothetical protein